MFAAIGCRLSVCTAFLIAFADSQAKGMAGAANGRSWATQPPLMLGLTQQDTSLMIYPSLTVPIFGVRLNNYKLTNPINTHPPNAGALIFQCVPVVAPPPGIPVVAGWGCADLTAMIPPASTTRTPNASGFLANKISQWCSTINMSDGACYYIAYDPLQGDGIPRMYPDPGQPALHFPAGGQQSLTAVMLGQQDIIWAITYGGLHCCNPRCQKPLSILGNQLFDNEPTICRIDDYYYHRGMRSPVLGDVSVRAGLLCRMCMLKGCQ